MYQIHGCGTCSCVAGKRQQCASPSHEILFMNALDVQFEITQALFFQSVLVAEKLERMFGHCPNAHVGCLGT